MKGEYDCNTLHPPHIIWELRAVSLMLWRWLSWGVMQILPQAYQRGWSAYSNRRHYPPLLKRNTHTYTHIHNYQKQNQTLNLLGLHIYQSRGRWQNLQTKEQEEIQRFLKAFPCFLGPLILCGQARTPASKFVVSWYCWNSLGCSKHGSHSWPSTSASLLTRSAEPERPRDSHDRTWAQCRELSSLGDLRHRGPSSSGALNRLLVLVFGHALFIVALGGSVGLLWAACHSQKQESSRTCILVNICLTQKSLMFLL